MRIEIPMNCQKTSTPRSRRAGSALPAELTDAIDGEPSPDDSPDSERNEASEEEIHDVALAVETSSYSPHGSRGDFPAQRK